MDTQKTSFIADPNKVMYMAFVIKQTGRLNRWQIRDRVKGGRELGYYFPVSLYDLVPSDEKALEDKMLTAHDRVLCALLTSTQRDNIAVKELRENVILYTELPKEGQQQLIVSLMKKAMYAPAAVVPIGKPKNGKVGELLDIWLDRKLSEQVTKGQKKCLTGIHRMIGLYFKEYGIKDTSQLSYDVGQKFVQWRSFTKFDTTVTPPKIVKIEDGEQQVAASTIRKELYALRNLAGIAYEEGWITNPHLWARVKVKITPKNKLDVYPFDINDQMTVLQNLPSKYHDACLLLLITGMRLSELFTLKPDSISEDADLLRLHGDGIGTGKVATAKTAYARRNLPVTPTIREIFRRGLIFGVTKTALIQKLKRLDTRFRKTNMNVSRVHAHSFRHSYAKNHLEAGENVVNVSKRMGHSDISVTMKNYGRFALEGTADYEKTKAKAKEHLDMLENAYYEKNSLMTATTD